MQTSELKLELFRYIDNLEESKLLKIYKYFISQNQDTEVDFWDALGKWQKEDIELGLEDLDKGRKRNFDDVMLKH